LAFFTMANKRDSSEPLDLKVWMSKGDASRARGVSRQAIWELVRRGRLTTRLYKGRVYVSRAEVMGFKPRPRGLAGTGYVKRKTIKRKKIAPPDASRWIYIVEAARQTGLPRLAIADLVRRGRIKKLATGTKTYVSRAGLDAFLKRTPEVKRRIMKK
jgi:excisionase family DNA binding protein